MIDLRPSFRHRLAAAVVLLGLLAFLLLYLALVLAAGYLFFQALVYPISRTERAGVLLKILAVVSSGMLFAFFLKGLFKRHQTDSREMLELTSDEQPDLFAFLRELCEATCAPFPHRVFVDGNVNAAVAFDSSLLNLVVPVKKNLVIGLGLVNALSLGEFRAVLAHEFGHFSQGSMALGSYVYVANRILVDMLYSRDRWDEFLERWKAQDLRVAIFGWVLYGVVALLRSGLTLSFKALNLANSWLSRQMEFHADLVAARVAGTDSIVLALSRLNLASQALTQAAGELRIASQHGLHTRDFFHHQSCIAAETGARPEPEPGQPVFRRDDQTAPTSMYASHPPDWEREREVRRWGLPADEPDRRPAWVLFRDPETLREQVSRRLYQVHWNMQGEVALAAPAEVQVFLDRERQETCRDECYAGLYDHRLLSLDDVAVLFTAPRWPLERSHEVFARLYGGTMAPWLPEHEARMREWAEFERKSPTSRCRFRGRRLTIEEALATLGAELDADQIRFAALDAEVLLAHLSRADETAARELRERYESHLALQELLQTVTSRLSWLGSWIAMVSGGRDLSDEDLQALVRALREGRTAWLEVLKKSESLVLPALANLGPGTPLRPLLLGESPLADLSPVARSVEGAWVTQLFRQMTSTEERLRRLHFKSLGALLALQERIAGHRPGSKGPRIVACQDHIPPEE